MTPCLFLCMPQEEKTMGGAGMGSEEKRAEMPAQG